MSLILLSFIPIPFFFMMARCGIAMKTRRDWVVVVGYALFCWEVIYGYLVIVTRWG